MSGIRHRHHIDGRYERERATADAISEAFARGS
jgi:hypothetical protein